MYRYEITDNHGRPCCKSHSIDTLCPACRVKAAEQFIAKIGGVSAAEQFMAAGGNVRPASIRYAAVKPASQDDLSEFIPPDPYAAALAARREAGGMMRVAEATDTPGYDPFGKPPDPYAAALAARAARSARAASEAK